MALNTSHNPNGEGVLIYNGEMILVYSKEVNLDFEKIPDPAFKGSKKGQLYLTSHRIIFVNKKRSDMMESFCFPFHCLRDVKLEQPIFGANYLKGTVMAQPGGNFHGDTIFKLTFNQGITHQLDEQFMKHEEMSAPPPYAPPAGGFFSPPPAYYTPATTTFNGFQAPLNAFPEHPPEGQVYMYESPPPYSGIGPAPPPYPAGATGETPQVGWNQSLTGQEENRNAGASAPPLPSYEEAIKQN